MKCFFPLLFFFGCTMLDQNDDYKLERELMVKSQIEARGIHDKKLLKTLKKTHRHLFVPKDIRWLSYKDCALPIGYGQTISQPYIVAFMIEAAKIKPLDRVLEIGTGSGYQAAILAKLCHEVYTIEIIEPLVEEARTTLRDLGYENVKIRLGNGYEGWKEEAPFDVIIVTASPSKIPRSLLDQLGVGGRLVIPVKEPYKQELIRVTKTTSGIEEEPLLEVSFVPMIEEITKNQEKSDDLRKFSF
ncbi:MAG TPA: protein-L-isoaspartate(D-aspartate) O-methyltransferase [Bdellovibrionota bacterium]|nr:protein-L-isoaspartate(D-aspartate) O-methyltransferase [Bdellovibrionota bacterium]